MERWQKAESAAGQASILFTAAGLLGILALAAPQANTPAGARVVSVMAVVAGVLAGMLPWQRWPERTTLLLVPVALGLILAGQWHDPAANTALYGMWFVLVFVWVGSWHPARTSLLVAPLAAAVYATPFLPGSPSASPDSLATVAVAIPIAVVLAEVVAAKTAEMRRAQEALESSAQLLERANLTDDLTGVGNRRMANALLDVMVPGDGLILLDLDHFKEVNDSLGHAEGDRVLMQLGSYLLDAVRGADRVARYGGEEFLVLVRSPGPHLAVIASRLLEGWRASGATVTLSAGAALHRAGDGPTATFDRTDALLYEAKAVGRDTAVVEPMAAAAHSARAS